MCSIPGAITVFARRTLRAPRALRGLTLAPGARACAFTIALTAHAAAAQSIAIVAASEESAPAARYVQSQLDDPTVQRATGEARDLDALVRRARLDWSEALIVIIDVERTKVSVVRSSDGTIGSRILSDEAAHEPYAVALAAVELLGIMRAAPAARSLALPAVKTAEAPARKEDHVSLRASLGAQNAAGLRGNIVLVQPALTLGVDRRAADSTWGLSAELELSGLTPQVNPYVHALPTGVDGGATLEYARNAICARGMTGYQGRSLGLYGYAEGGLAWVHLTLRDSDEFAVAQYRRAAGWVGAGAALMSRLSDRWSLAFAAGVAVFPTAATTRPTVMTFQEETLELRTRLGITWEAAL